MSRSKGSGGFPQLPKGRKNHELSILERRRIVAELYLEGHSYPEIAEKLGCTINTVHHDIKANEDEWRAQIAIDTDAAKALTLERIRQLLRTAWQEWHRSREDSEAEMAKTEKAPRYVETIDRNGKKRKRKVYGVVKEVTEFRKAGRLGDPRYLDQIAWCIEQYAKINGILEPEQTGTQKTTIINWQGMVQVVEAQSPEQDPLNKIIQEIVDGGNPSLPYGLKELTNGDSSNGEIRDDPPPT